MRANLVMLPQSTRIRPPERAMELALDNRLDQMNRRALLMDARRRLELADELRATLKVVVVGELNAPPLLENNQPFDLRASPSSFRVGPTFSKLLDPVRQRNNFRAAQVACQQARRNYMAAEDEAKLDVSHTPRRVRQEGNFELQRLSLCVAADQLLYAIEPAAQEQPEAAAAAQQGLSVSRHLENMRETQHFLIES